MISRASTPAIVMLVFHWKSRVRVATPRREIDRRPRIPFIEANASSSGMVTSCRTSSAEAPGYAADTTMVGIVMAGQEIQRKVGGGKEAEEHEPRVQHQGPHGAAHGESERHSLLLLSFWPHEVAPTPPCAEHHVEMTGGGESGSMAVFVLTGHPNGGGTT